MNLLLPQQVRGNILNYLGIQTLCQTWNSDIMPNNSVRYTLVWFFPLLIYFLLTIPSSFLTLKKYSWDWYFLCSCLIQKQTLIKPICFKLINKWATYTPLNILDPLKKYIYIWVLYFRNSFEIFSDLEVERVQKLG